MWGSLRLAPIIAGYPYSLHVTCIMQQEEKRYKPPDRILRPLQVPNRLLTGPGPTNCSPRVLQASALPMLGHLHPEFLNIMDDIKAGLQYAFQTDNSFTIAVSGTGHAGLEAALVNVVEPGDRVLVMRNGIWGERAQEVAERCGAVVNTLDHPLGVAFTLQEIMNGLEKYKPAVLFACQGESSSGACQPLEGVGDLCHRYNCLLLVDTVASLGGVPFYMDEWGVDVVYSGSQKVIGAPPGTAPISFSPRARAKISQRKTKIRSFYFDMNWLAKYWAVDDSPRVCHHTAPISSFYSLREALTMLAEEGLEACQKRHKENAELLWNGLEKLGLEMFCKDESTRLLTVSSITIPSDVTNWKELSAFAMKKYSVQISGGLGPSVGKVWRIGLMGYNSTAENVQLVLKVMEEGLKHCRDQMKAWL